MKSIFSKIIDKEIPCHLVAENNFAIAFMDINPIALGHVLVVPKKEVDDIFDLQPNLYDELWKFAQKVSFGLKNTIACKRVAISVIGLEVPHAHIHLIPIDNVSDVNFQNKLSISSYKLKEIAANIASNIN